MILAGFAALIPAGYIVYLVLSKKTGTALKRVSIGALILIVLAVIVCSLLLLMSGSPVAIEKGYTDIPLVPAEKEEDNTVILIALAIVILFLIMVIIISIREQQKLERNKKDGRHEENKKGGDNGQHNRKN